MREADMLTAYISAAMRKARYEILPDGEGYFGTIEELQGVWANADSLEACREELQEVLEEWIVLGLRKGHPLPEIDGISLNIREVA
jgi:predicted RNase H-like HicB family nuclease